MNHFYWLNKTVFSDGHLIIPIQLECGAFSTRIIDSCGNELVVDREEYTDIKTALKKGKIFLRRALAENSLDLAMDEITARQHNRD
jgi:hypothetical protein